jgi:hypothetical protein
MKFLLLSIFVTTCFGANLDVKPADLFTVAWEHQKLSQELEDDISRQLLFARTTISEVLRTSSDQRLHQVEEFHGKIFAYHNEALEAIAQHPTSKCFEELRDGVDAITSMARVISTNKLRGYNKNVESLTNEINQDFEALLVRAHDIVSKAFSHISFPQKIMEKIQQDYKSAQEDWVKFRPGIPKLLLEFRANIKKQDEELGRNFLDILETSRESYDVVIEASR